MKLLYNVSEAGNNWFITYYTNHKNKPEMIKSTYNPCLFYNFISLGIMKMQVNNIFILIDNNFASVQKNAIRLIKIMIKNKKHLIFIYFLKFIGIQIKLNLNKIILIKESHIKGIFLVIDYVVDSISSSKIIKKKLLPKE